MCGPLSMVDWREWITSRLRSVTPCVTRLIRPRSLDSQQFVVPDPVKGYADAATRASSPANQLGTLRARDARDGEAGGGGERERGEEDEWESGGVGEGRRGR